MAYGSVAQPIGMIRGRLLKPAQNNHAAAAAVVAVARRAVNVVALLPARQILRRNGEGKLIRNLAVDRSVVSQLVDVQMAASDRARNFRPLRPAISEKSRGLVGNILGLNVHVETASGGAKHSKGGSNCSARKSPSQNANWP